MSSKLKLFNERKVCPACKCKNSIEIIKLDWDNQVLVNLFKYRNYPINFIKEGAYVLLECENCSLIYQQYSPTKELFDKIYNKWLKKRNLEEIDIDDSFFNPYSAKKTIKNISEINQLLKLISKNPNDCKVFDFGMGWGGWCKAAKLMGLQSYGTEITESQIQYNKKQGLKVISWDNIPKYNFDFINTEQVLEHVDMPYEILKQLVKSLNSKGFLRISVPDAGNVKLNLNNDFTSEWFYAKGKKYSLNPVEPLQHLNGFTYKSLITLGSKLGLKKVNPPFGTLQKHSLAPFSFVNSMSYFFKSFLPIYKYLSFKRTNLLFQK